MQTSGLVLLLGGLLCGVYGTEEADPNSVWTFPVQTLLDRVQVLEEKLDLLQNSHVAFFVGLYDNGGLGNYGSLSLPLPIKYKHVRTNIGSGYNSDTGIFTAQIRGLYVFHVVMFSTYDPRPNTKAFLKKNDEILAIAVDESFSDSHDSSTQVAVVTLEAGDAVFVELQAGKQVYDADGHHNSFSGFLLYRM